MKLYSAFLKKNKEEAIEDLVLLKEGFSWSAFLFSGLWFVYHRMWKEVFALIIINFIFAAFGKSGLLSNFDLVCLELTMAVIIGLNANYWYANYLKERSYKLTGLVFGKNSIEAKINFIEGAEVNSVEPDEEAIGSKLFHKIKKIWKKISPLNSQTS